MNGKSRILFSVFLVALAAFLSVALATKHQFDWPFREGSSFRDVRNLSGPLGSLQAWFFSRLLGSFFAWYAPLVLAILGGATAVGKGGRVTKALVKWTGFVLLLNAFFSIASFARYQEALSGLAGRVISSSLTSVFGNIGGTIVLIACLLLVALSGIGDLGGIAAGALGAVKRGAVLASLGKAALSQIARALAFSFSYPSMRRKRLGAGRRALRGGEVAESLGGELVRKRQRRVERVPASSPSLSPCPEGQQGSARRAVEPPVGRGSEGVPLEEASLPPLSILQGESRKGTPFSREKLKMWSSILEEKLAHYNIRGRVTRTRHGPLITTFEFEPAPGVKIKDISSRTDDLALAMRAKSLRLLAPIPGRSVVGIEIPNPERRTVIFHDVLKQITDKMRLTGIVIPLGVDVMGTPFIMNLCNAPHLLIAGTTGSGKSVCLHVILASILFQYRPSDVRILIVDPKTVEMDVYNGLPHLLHPVISDSDEAIRVFKFLISEMHRRNELFRENGVKNIESFNSKIGMEGLGSGPLAKRLPYVVLVVDELGYLVSRKGAEVETLLSRLSNMARAVGIHMVVATQRPSVDVIVGKTKANFPTRIAFRVASKVDSRTILDEIGAEKLLGRGDMLFMDSKHVEPLRLHGALVSEAELERVVSHWKKYQYDLSLLDLSKDLVGEGKEDFSRDPLFDDAKAIVMQYRQGSTSLIQRKLHVGYARAARLLDQLEADGIVGSPDGSKPREVLIKGDVGGKSAFDD